MEFGALQCVLKVHSGICVFNDSCCAPEEKRESRPAPVKLRVKVRNRYLIIWLWTMNEKILNSKRTSKEFVYTSFEKLIRWKIYVYGQVQRTFDNELVGL
jgi:hypothetical protein